MAQLPPVLSLLLALLYVCRSDLRKGTNSKHLYKAEIEWDLLFRLQSSGGSFSESEAYAVLEELDAIGFAIFVVSHIDKNSIHIPNGGTVIEMRLD